LSKEKELFQERDHKVTNFTPTQTSQFTKVQRFLRLILYILFELPVKFHVFALAAFASTLWGNYLLKVEQKANTHLSRDNQVLQSRLEVYEVCARVADARRNGVNWLIL